MAVQSPGASAPSGTGVLSALPFTRFSGSRVGIGVGSAVAVQSRGRLRAVGNGRADCALPFTRFSGSRVGIGVGSAVAVQSPGASAPSGTGVYWRGAAPRSGPPALRWPRAAQIRGRSCSSGGWRRRGRCGTPGRPCGPRPGLGSAPRAERRPCRRSSFGRDSRNRPRRPTPSRRCRRRGRAGRARRAAGLPAPPSAPAPPPVPPPPPPSPSAAADGEIGRARPRPECAASGCRPRERASAPGAARLAIYSSIEIPLLQLGVQLLLRPAQSRGNGGNGNAHHLRDFADFQSLNVVQHHRLCADPAAASSPPGPPSGRASRDPPPSGSAAPPHPPCGGSRARAACSGRR